MSTALRSRLTMLAGVVVVLLLVGSTSAVSAQSPAIVTLTSPNSQYDGEFGYSVATNGNVAVVGAPLESVSGYADAGRAYIFNAETGALTATLTSPNSQYYGEFGGSVATNGNVVVVGGDSNAYTFSAETGTLITTLKSPNSQDLEEAGYSVATSGSVVVVGASFENVSGVGYVGSANISNAETGVLVATLTSPNSQEYGGFGYSVATNGNLAVVDAPGETVGGNSSAGRAYVFSAETGALTATLTSPDTQYYGNFGYSVAMSGNLVLVGAPGEVAGGDAFAGHAYIFDTASTISASSSHITAIAGSSSINPLVAGAVVIVIVIAVGAGGLALRTRRMKQKAIGLSKPATAVPAWFEGVPSPLLRYGPDACERLPPS